MSDAFEKKFLLLSYVPRQPGVRTAKEIAALLEEDGIPVSERHVLRLLQGLPPRFMIGQRPGKPIGFYIHQNAAPYDIPRMDPHTALTFLLVEEYLAERLPRSTVKFLGPHFKKAREVLEVLELSPVRKWRKKLRALPRTQPLVPPKVKPSVMANLYDALLHEKQIEVAYRGREKFHEKAVLHPLALVFRGSVGYLLATWWDLDDVTPLPLTRFDSARLLEDERETPRGFDLDKWLAEGHLEFRLGEGELKVKVRFSADTAVTVRETPLAPDQKLTEHKDGSVTVEAKVPDTRVLRAWLLGFGAHVEVLSPKKLRDDIAETARDMAAVYG